MQKALGGDKPQKKDNYEDEDDDDEEDEEEDEDQEQKPKEEVEDPIQQQPHIPDRGRLHHLPPGDKSITFGGPQNERQRAVVNAFRHAWKGYKENAWGHDHLR